MLQLPRELFPSTNTNSGGTWSETNTGLTVP